MEQACTEFVLIRHGLSEWNEVRRIQGHTDTNLGSEGREQARSLIKRLNGSRFDRIYSSDLKRSLQTAQPYVDNGRRELEKDMRLREWHLGAFEGLTVEEARIHFAEPYRRYRAFDVNLEIPEGESFKEFHNRCVAFFEEKARSCPGEHLLIFTHGGVVNVLLRHLLGIPMNSTEKFYIPNTSITRTKALCDGDQIRWSLINTEVDIGAPPPSSRETGETLVSSS